MFFRYCEHRVHKSSKVASSFLCVAGVVYWTVLGQGSQFGSIKRAYMTTFNDYGNNPAKEVNLNLRYIVKPEGIAVDWVGR